MLYKKHGHLGIEGYSDSNYTVDKRDRKSTFGSTALMLQAI